MTSASSGTICTTRIIISTVVRNLKRKRATATAASRQTMALTSTVTRATIAELRRYVPKPPSVSTKAKLSHVNSCGRSDCPPLEALASKALETIQ